MIGGLHPVTKAVRSPSFRNFVPKRDFDLLTSVKHGEFVVERDHGPPAGGGGELSHHALDDCHEGGAKSGAVEAVCFSSVVPQLLVSTRIPKGRLSP
jgi:hypothetical protein